MDGVDSNEYYPFKAPCAIYDYVGGPASGIDAQGVWGIT